MPSPFPCRSVIRECVKEKPRQNNNNNNNNNKYKPVELERVIMSILETWNVNVIAYVWFISG